MKKKMYSIRSYTKRETVLIRKLLSLLGETKESCIVISKKELVAIHEDYEKFLMKFMQNVIVMKDEQNIQYFQLIEHIRFEKDNVYFYVSNQSLLSENAFLLKNYLSLEHKATKEVLQYLLNAENYKEVVKLDTLKDMINCEGFYTRFYDFEKYVLQMLKQDIDSNTDFTLQYHKIKDGVYENAKVIAIELKLVMRNVDSQYHIPKFILKTKFSSAYNLQNEIYKFMEEKGIRLFNEYFFSPNLFMKLKCLKPGEVISINEYMKIICSNGGFVHVEFY